MSEPLPVLMQKKLQWSLFSLRLGVFIVMLMWTLDKFVNPAHGAAVFEKFYGIPDVSANLFYVLGIAQLILVLAFVIGYKKRLTYGIILLLHAGSTFSSYKQYLDGFNNLLFFAAWPMLAACLTLYLLRDADSKYTWGN
jgi:putative oxidoreductase